MYTVLTVTLSENTAVSGAGNAEQEHNPQLDSVPEDKKCGFFSFCLKKTSKTKID